MENKKDKKKVKNEKTKNIIWKVIHGISYVLSGCFIGVCCFACAHQSNNNKPKNNDVVYVDLKQELKVLPNYIQYNDEADNITLNNNELNNYVFYNLYQTDLFNTFSFSYNDLDFDYDSDSGNSYDYSDNTNFICFVYDYEQFNSQNGTSLTKNYVFINLISNNFEGDLIISCSTHENYLIVKSALQLDIDANNTPINDGIFETLTDSLVGYVDVLNQGLKDMVGIVYNSTTNQLTAIGILLTIVVAVSLGYFLFRLISSYIRLRG